LANTPRNLVVGFVFLGSLVILGVATLTVTSFSVFKKVEALTVRFPNVDNLQPGDDVVVYGYRVGEVKDIQYDPSTLPTAPIRVVCSVPKDVRDRLGAGTQFAVYSAGPLGGRYLEIQPPAGGTGVEPPEGYVGSVSADVFRKLGTFLEKNSDNVADAIREFKETFRSANQNEGTLGMLLKDKDTRDKVSKFITDATDMIASLKEDVTTQKGIVGYLLKDEKGKENLQKAVDNLNQTIEKLNSVVGDIKAGQGVIPRLLNDKDLSDKVTAIVDDFHETIHKVNSGQGTLGQIVNNPKAWDEIIEILVLARETIEDLREQAPVSTFVNAAFAAF